MYIDNEDSEIFFRIKGMFTVYFPIEDIMDGLDRIYATVLDVNGYNYEDDSKYYADAKYANPNYLKVYSDDDAKYLKMHNNDASTDELNTNDINTHDSTDDLSEDDDY
jgi:hypothetical protein